MELGHGALIAIPVSSFGNAIARITPAILIIMSGRNWCNYIYCDR
ncbi:hypothetical protein [Nostoc sp.]